MRLLPPSEGGGTLSLLLAHPTQPLAIPPSAHLVEPGSRLLHGRHRERRHVGHGLRQTRIDIQATPRGAHGVFVGIGPTADVDRYLAGTSVEVVTDFEVAPFRLTTQPRPGSASVSAPGSQDFWVARAEAASGTAALSWTVRDGDYRFVFMNADGTPAVNADARFGIIVPGARTLGVTVLLVGLVLVAGGVIALVLGLRAPVPPARGSAPQDAAADHTAHHHRPLSRTHPQGMP